jgi:hypothetical protein
VICGCEFRERFDGMSRRHFIMLSVVIAMIAEPAYAELQGALKRAPEFTRDELTIIARNEALAKVVKDDPWVVRNLLDNIDRAQPPISNQAIETPRPPEPPPNSFDPNENPDVERLQRASPEAVHDLFQLLKQAAEKGVAKPK